MFTPFLIELFTSRRHQVPGYNDTITAQTLRSACITTSRIIQAWLSKLYFNLVIRLPRAVNVLPHYWLTCLMDRVRHAPPDEILTVASQTLHDLKTKDLQIYVTNPQVEQLLVKFGDAAQVDRSPFHDGLYVVQANVSASKSLSIRTNYST